MPPTFTRFQYHRRDDVSEHGDFIFSRNDVRYGHTGIKNLKYNLELSQQEWSLEVSSGRFARECVFDISTSRNAFRMTAKAVGVARAFLRFRLDRDFGSFPVDALELVTRRNAAIDYFVATMYKGGAADPVVSGANISPAVDSVWEAFVLSPGGAYFPSDFLTLELLFSADTIGDYVEVGDLDLFYKNAQGNV